MPNLTLFFDGNCPFCAAEKTRLMKWDKAKKLAFVDISEEGFSAEPLGVDMQALNRELYGLTSDGKILIGIDSMLAAYTLVNRGWLVAPLRLPLLKPLLTGLYRGFARHRYRISAWLGLTPSCNKQVCHKKHFF